MDTVILVSCSAIAVAVFIGGAFFLLTLFNVRL